MNDEKWKRKLLGLKKIKIEGFKFVIKKINPLIDFPANKIPQIFTELMFKQNVDTSKNPIPAEIVRSQEAMANIIEAGLYYPKLVKPEQNEKKWHEEGLTIRDIFIDDDLAVKLYTEIMAHSLIKFKGLKGLFFSIRTKQWLLAHFQSNTGKLQLKCCSLMVVIVSLKLYYSICLL